MTAIRSPSAARAQRPATVIPAGARQELLRAAAATAVFLAIISGGAVMLAPSVSRAGLQQTANAPSDSASPAGAPWIYQG